MGQGVFGIEAASKYYFGKSSKDLPNLKQLGLQWSCQVQKI
jgi:membrane peptidoglycan carboxypeptidase